MALHNSTIGSGWVKLYLQTAAGVVLATLILSVSSCKSSKQIQGVINKSDSTITAHKSAFDSAALLAMATNHINSSNIDFEWFASKIKVDYTDIYKKNTNATAFVKMKKDEVIWLSLTGALGIEGFRAMLTPDSVVVMDKLQKTVSRRSISSIRDVINLPVDFKSVQDIILGNALFLENGISSIRFNEGNLLALSNGEFFKQLISIDTTSNTLISSKLDDVDEKRNRTAFIKWSDYALNAGRNFSNVREISVTEKNKLDIKLEFKQTEFDEPQSFPFNIPKSYQEK